MTHTLAILEVSEETFLDIQARIKATYEGTRELQDRSMLTDVAHAGRVTAISMDGLAIVRPDPSPRPHTPKKFDPLNDYPDHGEEL